jgi:hypothetical protein
MEEKNQCFASGFELNLGIKRCIDLLNIIKLLLVVSALVVLTHLRGLRGLKKAESQLMIPDWGNCNK